MAQEEFKDSFSVSTIAGSSFPNFLAAIKGKKVDKKYRARLILSGLASLFSEPFRWTENLLYGRKIRQTQITEDPIFILGHWRSGTTYLHNLLSQDENMAYTTTYQSIFPNMLLSGRWLFRTIMNVNMPKKRAADNVELGSDFPQEEEFAMANMNPYSYYYFWMFPRMTKELCDKYILLKGFDGYEKERWRQDYLTIIKKSLINTKGKRFISKNPPYTGRIPLLLELFPNARFIHIYRNPLTVFPSTVNFFSKTIPSIALQEISPEEIEDNIFYVYERMMKKYEQDKVLVPPQNLIEIRYEDFEKDPMVELKKIYQQLNLPGFEQSKAKFAAYIHTQQEFQSNNHQQTPQEVNRIVNNWSTFMQKWGYRVPEEAVSAISQD